MPETAEEAPDTPRALIAVDQRAELQTRIDSLLDAPAFRNARWGVLVVHPERGDTLYSRDAGKLFLPASNQKLVTGAVALRRLGAEYRFTTTVVANGVVRAGELRGNLVVHGTGDPTFSSRARGDALTPFLELSDSLRVRGIRRITGAVLAGDSLFLWPTRGYGMAWENLRSRFGAPVADLMFDEGSSRLSVRAGARTGAPVTAVLTPSIGYPRVRFAAITLPARSGDAPPGDTLRLEYDGEEVVLRGGIPLGEAANLDVIHPDPRLAFVAALRTALAQRQIVVAGVRQRSVRSDTLFSFRSIPLSELSALLQKPSQNQIAEVLKRMLAFEATGLAASDSGRTVLGDGLLELGAEPDGFIIGDASGMSRYNFLSPETIVRLLHAMRNDSVFVQSLPALGREGTLASRFRGSAAEGSGRAKTGSISNGITLSGYLQSADGQPLLFSIMANNFSAPDAEVVRTIDAVVLLLATMHYAKTAAAR